jgi:hypothetical protein
VSGVLIPTLAFSVRSLLQSINFQFNLQDSPIDSFLPVLAIGAIIGLTVIGVLWYQRIRNHIKGKKLSDIESDKSLDSLIEEIESFIQNWERKNRLRLGYKRKIENKSIGKWRFKLRKHSEEITKTCRNLRNSVSTRTRGMNEPHFIEISHYSDVIAGLGMKLESIFESRTSLKKVESTELNELIAFGDILCAKFRNYIQALEKLRSDLQ